jgi:RNA ligase
MQHKFPIIKRIEDVLPAIVGRDEFFVAERDGFRVINYTVAYDTSFEIDETDLMDNYGTMIPTGIMRRECRGIIFFPDGTIMSRPFDKWFNIGERTETLLDNIEFHNVHSILSKLDGSMLRPLNIHGKMCWGTKMGPTDVAVPVDDFCNRNPNYNNFASWAMQHNLTPIFEWCSPDNRIVVNYTTEQLTLLAIRENVSGRYLPLY